MKKFDEMGCEYCRNGWLSGNPPPQISENEGRWSTLHKCPKCNTYWEASLRFATEISEKDARDYYQI